MIAGKGLTQRQQKALDVLRDSFTAEAGATRSEWQRSCQDVPERTFHRVTKLLIERGCVRQSGSHFRIVEGPAMTRLLPRAANDNYCQPHATL